MMCRRARVGKGLVAVVMMVMLLFITRPLVSTGVAEEVPDLEKMYVGPWSEAEGRLQVTGYTYTDRSGKQDLSSSSIT